MKTAFHIETFSLAGICVHLASASHASLLSEHAIKSHLRGEHAGYLLGVFQIRTSEDLHSDVWEMHAAGDEFLFMLSGALDVEFSDGTQRQSAPLEAGHGVVVPKGRWHRLLLREPGQLLALSPPQGTQLSHNPT